MAEPVVPAPDTEPYGRSPFDRAVDRAVTVAVAAGALVALPAVRLGVRAVGFGPMHRNAQRVPVLPLRRPRAEAVRRGVCWAASHGPYKAPCVPRSLVLLAALRALGGGDCELCIGVRREPGALAAHAWVEQHGVAVAEPADVRQRFGTFGSRDLALFARQGGRGGRSGTWSYQRLVKALVR